MHCLIDSNHILPVQRRRENPPKSCLQNLTHSGVTGGGVSRLRPNFFLPSTIASSFFPKTRSVWNLLQRTSTSTMWKSTSSSCFRSFKFGPASARESFEQYVQILAIPGLFFAFIFGLFQTIFTTFKTQINMKMSIPYTVLKFKPTAFRIQISTSNPYLDQGELPTTERNFCINTIAILVIQ